MKHIKLVLAAMLMLTGLQAKAEKKVYTAFDENTGTVTFYYDDLMDSRPGIKELYEPDEMHVFQHFMEYDTKIKKAVIDPSMQDANLTSTARMFSIGYEGKGLTALKSIEGLENLNTANVTDMSYMFEDCRLLTSLDMSHFETNKVTSMCGMFKGCESLASLDLNSFNTTNVTTMRRMFSGCHSLTSLDLSDFHIVNVTDMSDMFFDCRSLVSLDISSFYTVNVTDMRYMFAYCESLKSLDISMFRFDKLEDTECMFLYDAGLNVIYCNEDLSQSETLKNSKSMFKGCYSIKGANSTTYDKDYTDKQYAQPDGGDQNPGYFSRKKEGKLVYLVFNENTGTLTYYYDDEIYNDIERPGIKEAYKTDYSIRIIDCHTRVKKVVIDASMKDAPLTSMRRMFCPTANIKENGMSKDEYRYLENLTSISGLENLNTTAVTDMSYMFKGCRSLVSLDLSGLNTANVTTMINMFADCSALKTIQFGGDFTTANVTNMYGMFSHCVSLRSLDLSQFDIRQLTNATNMFASCTALKTIYCIEDWQQSTTLKGSLEMFVGCFAVEGNKGTCFINSNPSDKTYARPDGGKDRPGYFTLLSENALIDGVCYLLDYKTNTAQVLPLPEGKYEGNLYIPDKVTWYGKNYPITRIGDNAFRNCDGITSLTVSSIEPQAVGTNAFEGVPTDISIYVPNESLSVYKEADGWNVFADIHTSACVIDGICYELNSTANTAKVVALPKGKYKGNIILPEEISYEGTTYEVSSIGTYAFARCNDLLSVSIPSTVTDIAEYAIVGNPALMTINISADNSTYSDICGVVFSKDKKTLLIYPTGRYGGWYEVPEGTTRIEHNVFNGADLRGMILPESLKEIGDFAFDQIPHLLWIVSKASTPPATEAATFYGVDNQIPVYVLEENLEAYRGSNDWKYFSNILSGIQHNVQSGEYYYDLCLWNNTAEVAGPVNSKITTVDVPEAVEVQLNGSSKSFAVSAIGRQAFYGCQSLTGLTLPEGVKEIKPYAFAKCTKLEEMELPSSLTTIGENAFAGCALEDVYIPDGVTTIGNYAFDDCRNMKWIELGTGVLTIGTNAFLNDGELLAVYENGEDAPVLGRDAFKNCKKLQAIYVPCNALANYEKFWLQYADLLKNEEFSYFTITAAPSEHGSIEVPVSSCYPYMTAIPDEGYEFVRWSDGNTDNPRLMERPSKDETYGAVFDHKKFLWQVASNNDAWGYVSTPQTESAYPINTEMTAIAVPKTGYKFVKWNDGSEETHYNLKLTEDTYLRAIFIGDDKEPDVPEFKIEVTAATIRWYKVPGAYVYTLTLYADESYTEETGMYIFDQNGDIIDYIPASGTPRRATKEEQEEHFQYTITGLNADTKYYFRMQTHNAEEKLIYTDEGDFRTLNAAVYAVIHLIDAIGEVTYTPACGVNIRLAREAYDALSDEDKALVTNYETLTEAEKQYAELEKAAKETALKDILDEYKTALDELLQDNDTEECLLVVSNAKDAVDAIQWDDSKSFSENLSAIYTACVEIYLQAEADLAAIREKETPTGMDETADGSDRPRKVLIRGQMYILHHGAVYNAQGARVR
ncbi:MAG: leucine-rich repeat protein [Paludibacteraceae bacterium]|nr:leucine-rich repeat protein [Paludibacteraceae bacterium]